MTDQAQDRQTLTFEEIEEMFHEYYNERHDTVFVCGYEMDQSRILAEVDPVAFRQEVLDFINFNEEIEEQPDGTFLY